MNLPILYTKRLIIRPLAVSDAEDMFKNYGSDPKVSKFLSWDVHKSIEDSKNTVNFFIESFSIANIEYYKKQNKVK